MVDDGGRIGGRLARPRVRRLFAALVALVIMVAVRGGLGLLPHEPRLFLSDESLGTFNDRAIRSPCGDVELPRIAEGRSVRIDLVPHTGCEYELHGTTLKGDHLLRLIAMGRERKEDIQIEVGIDYVETDLTTRHKMW